MNSSSTNSTSSVADSLPQYRTKSGRLCRPPDRLIFKAVLEPFDYLNNDTFQNQHTLFFKAKSDPDSMYYHQVMKQPDKVKFIEAIEKEHHSHFKDKNYELMNFSQRANYLKMH
jgi:hypothetical protein